MPGKKKIVTVIIDDEIVVNKIYYIRGQKVMLDRDLAEMYGILTYDLKRAVRRNASRFPDDFMFEMTADELNNWRRQFGASNSEQKGLRYAPYCFTEHGVLMLSSVVNSQMAIQVNIAIMRVYSKMKTLMASHKEILNKIEKLENATSQNSEDIQKIFRQLKKLVEIETKPRTIIGFRIAGRKK
ncbi:MAG: ORF6N domain-containing protein [Flavobacteriales bacterium]